MGHAWNKIRRVEISTPRVWRDSYPNCSLIIGTGWLDKWINSGVPTSTERRIFEKWKEIPKPGYAALNGTFRFSCVFNKWFLPRLLSNHAYSYLLNSPAWYLVELLRNVFILERKTSLTVSFFRPKRKRWLIIRAYKTRGEGRFAVKENWRSEKNIVWIIVNVMFNNFFYCFMCCSIFSTVYIVFKRLLFG